MSALAAIGSSPPDAYKYGVTARRRRGAAMQASRGASLDRPRRACRGRTTIIVGFEVVHRRNDTRRAGSAFEFGFGRPQAVDATSGILAARWLACPPRAAGWTSCRPLAEPSPAIHPPVRGISCLTPRSAHARGNLPPWPRSPAWQRWGRQERDHVGWHSPQPAHPLHTRTHPVA